MYHLRVLDDSVIAVSVPVDVNDGRRESGDDMRLRPPGCEGARVPGAVLRQARRKERGVRVRRVQLVRPGLVDVVLLAERVVILIRLAPGAILREGGIHIEPQRDGDGLLDLVDPRRRVVLLWGGDLAERILEEDALHVPARPDPDGPRSIARGVSVRHDGLEHPLFVPCECGGPTRLGVGARPVEAEGRGGCLGLGVACRRLVTGVGLDDVVQDGFVEIFEVAPTTPTGAAR